MATVTPADSENDNLAAGQTVSGQVSLTWKEGGMVQVCDRYCCVLWPVSAGEDNPFQAFGDMPELQHQPTSSL